MAITTIGGTMRILIIDIETRPSLAYVWSLWDEHVTPERLIEEKEVISFAAKWHGEPKIIFASVHHDGMEAMVRRAWDLLGEADCVVSFNGRKFDVPHLNREFLNLGLEPPAPFKQVDLLQVVRRQFRFASNSLNFVTTQLELGSKVKHAGFKLWIGCMAGDDKAWREMRRYNIQDVTITEALYDRLLPWITGHPSYGAMEGLDICPRCGSAGLVKEGRAFTATGSYQRFRCANGHWSRSCKRESGTAIMPLAA